VDYSVYLVTERGAMDADAFCNAIEEAILGGVSIVQLREKDITTRAFYEMACRIRQMTAYHATPLIINDRLDIALAAGADGLHVGADDLPVAEARRVLGDKLILGATAATVEAALAAEAAGADYIGSGAIHATPTKPDKAVLPLSELARIRAAVKVPVVAIGGITLEDVVPIRHTGADGVAVVRAIMGSAEPKVAANRFRAAWDKK
jgi:thiamine-phosphate pyrophosphorylase